MQETDKCGCGSKTDLIKKYLTKDNLIILILVGVLLFLVAMPVKKEDSSKSREPLFSLTQTGNSDAEENEGIRAEQRLKNSELYAAELEQRLQDILTKVDGVGKVTVMVTLSATEEVKIEKNENISESVTEETDANGGTRKITQTSKNASSLNDPIVKMTFFPKLEGVLVVAQGCGNGSIDKKITEMVSAVTGLEAHRIVVAKMR